MSRALVCGAGTGPARVHIGPPLVTRAAVLPRLWELVGDEDRAVRWDDLDDGREDSTRMLMRALAIRLDEPAGARTVTERGART